MAVMIKYRWRRFINSLGIWGPSESTSARPSVFSLFLAIATFFGILFQSHQLVARLESLLADPATNFGFSGFPLALEGGLAWVTFLLWFAVLLMNFAGRELRESEWDLEWLLTLPVARRNLLWGRFLERMLLNPIALAVFIPWSMYLSWRMGLGWWVILSSVLFFLLASSLEVSLRMILELGVRGGSAHSSRRKLQGISSLASAATLFLVLSILFMPRPPILGIMDRFGSGPFSFFPPFRALFSVENFWIEKIGAVMATIAISWLALLLVEKKIRRGMDGAGPGREARVSSRSFSGLLWRLPLAPLYRRELLLLFRDPNYLAQSFLVPAFLVLTQIYVHSQAKGLLALDLGAFSAFSFGAGAYSLIFSALQGVKSEGAGLWIPFTLSRSPGNFFQEKGRFWTTLGLLYPALFFIFASQGPYPWGALLLQACFVFAGILVFSRLALAFGILGFQSGAGNQRLTFRYLYLFFLLSGAYGALLVGGDLWTKFLGLVLAGIVALGFWQRALDRLPWLFEDNAASGGKPSLAEGGLALAGFFLLQTLGTAFFGWKSWGSFGEVALLALVGSASLVGALVFWRHRASGNGFGFFGLEVPLRKQILMGLGVGLVAGGLGCLFSYLFPSQFSHWIRTLAQDREWHGAVVVSLLLLAPIGQEILHRGLVLRSIERSWGAFRAVIGSALLFSLLWGPSQIWWSFLLGILLGSLALSKQGLWASIVAHGIFNVILFIILI